MHNSAREKAVQILSVILIDAISKLDQMDVNNIPDSIMTSFFDRNPEIM